MRTNRLRATLKADGIALGTIVWDSHGRGVMHTLAATGGRICTEHSAFNLETVVGLVGHGAAITPIVRIAGLQYKHVTRYGTDLILLRRGAERAAQTLAPLRKRAAAWAWQSRSENRIRILYIS
jgi:hypothetical protein